MTTPLTIRPIRPEDNAPLATLIRDILASIGRNRPGTVYSDPTTDHLFELFQRPGSMYMVAEQDGRVLGGGGIFHADGLASDTVELARVYLVPEARGLGLGRRLVEACLEAAINYGYRFMYLETAAEMVEALPLYEKLGFQYLDSPMGNTGHFSVDIWMVKELT
jgi:putative acetyltransferase